MPTIDQLAPATAASDTDLLVVEQSGITRKLTRAQLEAGLQPQLVLASGNLVGRSSAGTGPAEIVQLGANLALNAGTLSATASPFQASALPQGAIPSSADLVPVGQNGTNVAVTYSEFLVGLSAVAGIDISGATLTTGGGVPPQTLAQWADGVLLKAGGTLTGALTAQSLAISESSSLGTVATCGSLALSGALSVAGPLSAASAVVEGNASFGGTADFSGAMTVQSGVTISGGLAQMPSYQVAALPAARAGAVAYATNGRKPSEAAGAGTGVLVWGTATGEWLSVMSGSFVQA